MITNIEMDETDQPPSFVSLTIQWYVIHSPARRIEMHDAVQKHFREKLRGLRRSGLRSFTFETQRVTNRLDFIAYLKWSEHVTKKVSRKYFEYYEPKHSEPIESTKPTQRRHKAPTDAVGFKHARLQQGDSSGDAPAGSKSIPGHRLG